MGCAVQGCSLFWVLGEVPWTDVFFMLGKQNQAPRSAASLGCFLPRCRAGTDGAGAGSSRQGECEQSERREQRTGREVGRVGAGRVSSRQSGQPHAPGQGLELSLIHI